MRLIQLYSPAGISGTCSTYLESEYGQTLRKVAAGQKILAAVRARGFS